MSWFKSSGLDLSGFAKTAFAQAQKSIDKVLDIQDAGSSTKTKEESKFEKQALQIRKKLPNADGSDHSKEASSGLKDRKDEDVKCKQSVNAGSTTASPSLKIENDNFFDSFFEESSYGNTKIESQSKGNLEESEANVLDHIPSTSEKSDPSRSRSKPNESTKTRSINRHNVHEKDKKNENESEFAVQSTETPKNTSDSEGKKQNQVQTVSDENPVAEKSQHNQPSYGDLISTSHNESSEPVVGSVQEKELNLSVKHYPLVTKDKYMSESREESGLHFDSNVVECNSNGQIVASLDTLNFESCGQLTEIPITPNNERLQTIRNKPLSTSTPESVGIAKQLSCNELINTQENVKVDDDSINQNEFHSSQPSYVGDDFNLSQSYSQDLLETETLQPPDKENLLIYSIGDPRTVADDSSTLANFSQAPNVSTFPLSKCKATQAEKESLNSIDTSTLSKNEELKINDNTFDRKENPSFSSGHVPQKESDTHKKDNNWNHNEKIISDNVICKVGEKNETQDSNYNILLNEGCPSADLSKKSKYEVPNDTDATLSPERETFVNTIDGPSEKSEIQKNESNLSCSKDKASRHDYTPNVMDNVPYRGDKMSDGVDDTSHRKFETMARQDNMVHGKTESPDTEDNMICSKNESYNNVCGTPNASDDPSDIDSKTIIKEDKTSYGLSILPSGMDGTAQRKSEVLISEDDTPCSQNIVAESMSHVYSDKNSVLDNNSYINDDFQAVDTQKPLLKSKEHSEEVENLKKEIFSLKEIISAREEKMVSLSKENISLQDTTAILRSQLNQLENNRTEDDSEMEEMRQEFARRIAETVQKLSTVTKERNNLQQNLEETELRLSARLEEQEIVYSNALKEKELQIMGLLEEGEKLSKKELKSNNTLKKFKVKLKEQESKMEEIRQKLEETEKREKTHLETISTAAETEKGLKEKLSNLEMLTDSQEDEISRLKDQMDDALEKHKELQTNLDSVYLELQHVKSEKAQEISEVQEATIINASKEMEDLRKLLDDTNRQAKIEKEKLQLEVEDLQSTISRMSNSIARKEEHFKAEIKEGLSRLQDAETRNQDLSQSISAATRPLLRQIESLQSSLSSQAENWERVEKNHADAMASLQQQLAFASEKERTATVHSTEMKARMVVLEDSAKKLKQEKEKLTISEQEATEKIESLSKVLQGEREEADRVQSAMKKSLHNLENDKIFLEQQLSTERARVEAEITRISSEMYGEKSRLSRQSSELISLNESQLNEPDVITSHPPHQSRSRTSSTGSSQVMNDSSSLKGASTAALERLQTQLRQRDGEIHVLKEEIQSLERTRSSLAQELLDLSSRIIELEATCQEIEKLRSSNKDLQERYAVTLQMYGEKAEEADELRMDLEDVKQMYKQQIQDLFSSR